MRVWTLLALLIPATAVAGPVEAVEGAVDTLEARREAAEAVGDRGGVYCLDPYVVRARQLAKRARKLDARDDPRAAARLLATRERAERLVASVTPACPAARPTPRSARLDEGLYRADSTFGLWAQPE